MINTQWNFEIPNVDMDEIANESFLKEFATNKSRSNADNFFSYPKIIKIIG